MHTVLILNKQQMGQGDPELGRRLLGAALRKLAGEQVGKNLSAVVLFNAGVHLCTKDSPVAAELRVLEDRGVEILLCGTCVDHYGIKDELAFDRVSNMDEILAMLDSAAKTITM